MLLNIFGLLREIDRVGGVARGYAVDDPIVAELLSLTDLADGKRKCILKLLGAAHIGNRTVMRKRIGGFHFHAQGFGGCIERFAARGALGKVLRARASQIDGLFPLIVGQNLIVNLGERAGMRRQYVLGSEDGKTGIDLNGAAEFARAKLEKGLMQIGRPLRLRVLYGDRIFRGLDSLSQQ